MQRCSVRNLGFGPTRLLGRLGSWCSASSRSSSAPWGVDQRLWFWLLGPGASDELEGVAAGQCLHLFLFLHSYVKTLTVHC